MIEQTGFTFNGDYGDLEQVAAFLPDFERALAEIEASGKYRYNDSFRGRIPGLAVNGQKAEDTGIYLLQGLHDARAQAAKVAALIAGGYEPIAEVPAKTAFKHIVLYPTRRMGGSWAEYRGARLVPDKGGRPYAVLPRGAVTRGYLVGGRSVLVLR